MDITLRPITEEEYNEWIVISTNHQAKDQSSASGKTMSEEMEKLNKMLPLLLPNGPHTERHHFYVIDTLNQPNIGFLWIGKLPHLDDSSIFLFDIYVRSEYRSKGIGRTAMIQLEEIVNSLQYDKILLHVLKSNYARNLYESLGYVPIENHEYSLIMEKEV
ncbi:MAG: GNAT family N-acetyltransferase [Candidatus Izemoplasmatales bacterium]